MGSAEGRDRESWTTLKGKLPDLPTTEVNGVRTLAPAAKYDQKKNIENPELYAVFPFRLVSFEGPAAELGREAYRRRQDPGNSGWRQDLLFAAYLGLTEEVRRQVADRAQNKDKHSRFPAFWGPNYDWVPDQCHGGVLMKAVQAMLMQSDGNRIFFFPAWPAEWKVSFRLHAPFGTVVTGFGRDGQLEQLSVLPKTRRKDITVLPVR